jgi:asparagine synthase (glutamine-hydrolysing)
MCGICGSVGFTPEKSRIDIFAHRGPDGSAERLGPAAGIDMTALCGVMTSARSLQVFLRREDWNSMAHLIEARVSFFDHRFVEFSLPFGNEHKNVGWDTKRVLRRAMEFIFTGLVTERTDKLGFSILEMIWFRGLPRVLVLDGVEATLRQSPGLWSACTVRTLAAGILDGRHPMDFLLWRVVNLGVSGQRFGVVA